MYAGRHPGKNIPAPSIDSWSFVPRFVINSLRHSRLKLTKVGRKFEVSQVAGADKEISNRLVWVEMKGDIENLSLGFEIEFRARNLIEKN